MSNIVTEKDIVNYYKNQGIEDTSFCFCKDCGKLIAYDTDKHHFSFKKDTGNLQYINGLSFLSTRIYNGHEYRLCRCYDCVCKAYPEFKDVRFKFAHKVAKYTQYGFGVSDEDFNVVSKERQSVTKEKMIKKYGLNEGEKKWQAYCDKQAITNSFEYKHKKYGMSRKEFYDYNQSRAVTLENMIKRYGEEIGNQKWNEYCERQRYTTTKEYFIEQYGEIEGAAKYEIFSQKRAEGSIHSKQYSQISEELFNALSQEFKNHINHILYGSNEYQLSTLGGHYYNLDYYDKKLNIVVEFFGDYFHFNPKKYSSDTVFRNIKAQDKWDRDAERLEDIQNTLDCKIIVIWEASYMSNKQDTIATVIDFIKNQEQLENITYV